MMVKAIQGRLREQLEELEKHCGTMADGGSSGMVPPIVYDYASNAGGNGGSCWQNGEPYQAGGGSSGTTGFGGRVLRRDETGRLYDSCEKCGQMMYADRGGPVRCGQDACPIK